MKILIVEDDKGISDFIQRGLKESGFSVDQFFDGETGFLALTTSGTTYDLVILDLMLPKMGGLELLEKARNMGVLTPVIILSAKRSLDDRILGLQKGGDDYLTKPFSFSELLVRIQAILRRTATKAENQTNLSRFGIQMDLVKRTVTRDGVLIDLQAKEFNLLEFFLRNPERVLSKTSILEYIYGYQFNPQTNVVDVLVFRLRNKIDKNFQDKTIHTLRGSGYVFKLE
jgi:DNA-binding response OmpR family regulator